MWKLDFGEIPLKKRLLYSALLLLTIMYPGQNKVQLLSINPGEVISYDIPEQQIAEYPENDGQEAPYVSARAVVIQDVNSKALIYEKNSDIELLPASTTKIMTALVALDYYHLDDVLTVASENHAIGSSMDLAEGEKISVNNLIYGLLVGSGNDAALTLADNFCAPNEASGEVGLCGYDAFVEAMNDKATELHLDNTHYRNPSGIESYGHVTTARDLAVLASYAVQNQTINQVMQTKEITVTDVSGEIIHNLENTNELLGELPGVMGLKTGWTENAGECLVTLVERDNHPVITVVLGSLDRFGETTKLIDWIYSHHTWTKIDT